MAKSASYGRAPMGAYPGDYGIIMVDRSIIYMYMYLCMVIWWTQKGDILESILSTGVFGGKSIQSVFSQEPLWTELVH